MPIRRMLFLCFLTVTLGLTGPFARGLSFSQAAVFPQTLDLTRLGTVSDLKTGTNPSKRCQRGAITWSNCGLDIGYTPLIPRLMITGTVMSFDTQHGGAANSLRSSRIFRPPRSS